MPGGKRKLSLVEILVIIAILWIFLSIIAGAKHKQKAQRAVVRPPAAYETTEPGKGDRFFWRP
jgi:beta-lactamase regulating signal transducer with metallopeptidase domain